MSTPSEILAITDIFIQHLNDEVLHWQRLALAASMDNDELACQKALRAQDNAIHNLIKFAETKRNTLLKSGIISQTPECIL